MRECYKHPSTIQSPLRALEDGCNTPDKAQTSHRPNSPQPTPRFKHYCKAGPLRTTGKAQNVSLLTGKANHAVCVCKSFHHMLHKRKDPQTSALLIHSRLTLRRLAGEHPAAHRSPATRGIQFPKPYTTLRGRERSPILPALAPFHLRRLGHSRRSSRA
jgi:hypothetical protein